MSDARLEQLIKQLDQADAAGARQIVEQMRAVRNGITNPSKNGNQPTQGVKIMNEISEQDGTEWVDELTPEEKQQVQADIDASRQKILAARRAKGQAELNQQFNTAMAALFRRTNGRPSFTEKQAVKDRFAAQGLTDFTARRVENGQ